MYDFETITQAIFDRMNQRPFQALMESSCMPFNVAWNMFLESPIDNPSDFTDRFYATQRGAHKSLPTLHSTEGTIQHATRYASMGYITCAIIKAMQNNSNGTASDLFVIADIGSNAKLLMDLNEKVKSFMALQRPVHSEPLGEKLHDALSDFYTVMLIALNEIKPIASRNADTAKAIIDTMADCFTIVVANNLTLHIPRELALRASGDLLGERPLATGGALKRPSGYEPVPHDRALVPQRPETGRTGYYGRPPKATAQASTPKHSATVLYMNDEARERLRQRRLVEAAKRTNPADPGHTPKP